VAQGWLLLIYKIPREPTAARVHVWRSLQRLGAASLQDAAWVLPETARTREQLQWLSAEIVERGGEASLFSTELLFAGDPQALRAMFELPVRGEYQSILAALKRKKPDLPELAKRYTQARERDYFSSQLGEEVRTRLLQAQENRP
jgi:hypothetical protein